MSQNIFRNKQPLEAIDDVHAHQRPERLRGSFGLDSTLAFVLRRKILSLIWTVSPPPTSLFSSVLIHMDYVYFLGLVVTRIGFIQNISRSSFMGMNSFVVRMIFFNLDRSVHAILACTSCIS